MPLDTIGQLAATIAERRSSAADQSYTRKLLDGGPEFCARKFGEEAIEVVIAALGQSDEALAGEAADAVYHLIVLMESRRIPWQSVTGILAARMGTSGIAEKASRVTPPR
jgi:phosphoribosyl-ATP pyrophosphohydrolase